MATTPDGQTPDLPAGVKNDSQQQFKLPIAKDPSSTSSSQALNNTCANQPSKLSTPTRAHSTIEMPSTDVPENKPHALKRKTSVFSHSGFTAIHKLDQATIQQHPIVANNTLDKQDVRIDDSQPANKSQQQQQETSPRRPNRSDTLGSTGSSRASSCDEPTIASPTKLFPNTVMQPQQQQQQQQQKSQDLKQSATSTNLNVNSASPIHEHESSFATISSTENVASVKASESDLFKGESENPKDVENDSSDDDEEDDEDEDDDDVVFTSQTNFDANKDSSNLKIPPFESIKTQLKRNSIPNAQVIKHIENLISRNSEIVENWNQVSIRSYNSSSQSATTTGNKRPSKRWSTTSIGKTMPSLERKCSTNLPPKKVSTFHMNEQQVQFDGQANFAQQLGRASCNRYELKPPHVSLSMPTSPKQPTGSAQDTKNYLQDRFPSCDVPYEHNLRQPSALEFSNHRPSITIENAIRNLSLKKHEDHSQMHQDPLSRLGQRDDIVMAAIMVERQRQQRLLEDCLRIGSQHPPEEQHFRPEQILDHYQQQLIEQQLALTRLAALESEYQQQQQRQQVAASLVAASIQNQQHSQQQQLPSSSQQLVHQFNCLTANQALENQLLNDYISKMVLSREEIYKSQARNLPIAGGDTIQQQQSKQPPTSSPSKLFLGHGTEMLTQSLDSATPSHRCDACDISFWTRDLLNYHTMTSCSARRGPGPTRPIAFNFNQPNGFDLPTTSTQGQHSMVINTPMFSPTVFISEAPDNQPSSSTCRSTSEHSQSKSVSPTRRRTYNELDRNSSQELSLHIKQSKRQSSGSMFSHLQDSQTLRNPYAFDSNDRRLPASSPNTTHEPVNLASHKKLDPALTSVLHQHKQLSTNIGEESNLPIKKRKISEPNMRY